MNLTKRAQSLFPPYAKGPFPLTLQLIASYAAQNPGLDYCDYSSPGDGGHGRRAYFSDARSITSALKRVRQAMRDAYYAGATDADVIEASQHAFSGRLTIKPAHQWVNGEGLQRYAIDYCTGQYWPTEYRSACASVLEAAARLAKSRMGLKVAA